MIEGTGKRIFAGLLATCLIGGVALAMLPADRPAIAAAANPAARGKVARPQPIAAVPAKAPSPKIDMAAPPAGGPQPYVVRHVLTIPKPLRQGDFYWDESAAPAKGPIVVTVDLAAQTVSVFRDGYEIGTGVIIYGSDDTPTPLGIFPITQKDADHVSTIYGSPMPYMLRLTGDGISIHGSEVGDGYVTHGCVGVPTAFARKIFAAVKIGDKVIITRGERLDVGQAITAA